MDAEPDEFDPEYDAALLAAVDAVIPPKFRESGTRKVSKILRGPSGRWMKRRSSTPIHTPTWREERNRKVAVPVYNLTQNPLSGLPPDVYERLDALVGGPGKPPGWAHDTIAVIRSVRGRPDAPVRVFTATPPEVEAIHPGDWVSLTPGFARTRAKAYPRWRVVTATVPAAQVLTRSDDLLRWTLVGARPIAPGAVEAPPPARARRIIL